MIRILLLLWLALSTTRAAQELRIFTGCTYVATPWADGDSFAVKLPDGSQQTVRLYGLDCIEIHVTGDMANARRLNEQRRYFGIDDILAAKASGEVARQETATALSKPFILYTAFASARGDARFSRIYGFITTSSGEDLASLLVGQGLARAYGVARQRPDGSSGEEWKKQLADLELTAARAGRGAWAKTDWEKLAKFRKEARDEAAELEIARGESPAGEGNPVNINRATREELMTLPGIGEKTAARIIAARPFRSVNDLLRSEGIGPVTLARLKPLIFL